MTNKQLTLEDIEGYLTGVFNQIDTSRNIEMRTGRGGAIQNEIEVRKLLSDKPEQQIIDEVNAMIWEDGVYLINSTGCHYQGLWDDEKPDGQILVKRYGNWYIENWISGYRNKYAIISESEANKIIKELEQ